MPQYLSTPVPFSFSGTLTVGHHASLCRPLEGCAGQIGTSLVREVVGPMRPGGFSEGVQARVGPGRMAVVRGGDLGLLGEPEQW